MPDVGPVPDAGSPGFGVRVVPLRFVARDRAGAGAGALRAAGRCDPGRSGAQSSPAGRSAGSAGDPDQSGLDLRRRLAAGHVVRAVSARQCARRRPGRGAPGDLQQSRGRAACRPGSLRADRAAQCGSGGLVAARLSDRGRDLDRAARPGRRGRGAADLRLLGAERARDQSRRGAERDVRRPDHYGGGQQPAGARAGGGRAVVDRRVRAGRRRDRRGGRRRAAAARGAGTRESLWRRSRSGPRTPRSGSSPTTPPTPW